MFCWFIEYPDRAVGWIDASGATRTQHLPGCQDRGVAKRVLFRWQIAGEE